MAAEGSEAGSASLSNGGLDDRDFIPRRPVLSPIRCSMGMAYHFWYFDGQQLPWCSDALLYGESVAERKWRGPSTKSMAPHFWYFGPILVVIV